MAATRFSIACFSDSNAKAGSQPKRMTSSPNWLNRLSKLAIFISLSLIYCSN